MYDKKIAIVIQDDLQTWQKLNVVSFLTSGITTNFKETHGENLITKDDRKFLPLLKHPILIYKADTQESLQRAFSRASDRDLEIGIFTKQLFDTRMGEENVTEIAQHLSSELDLVGIIMYGENKKINKALDGLKFHD